MFYDISFPQLKNNVRILQSTRTTETINPQLYRFYCLKDWTRRCCLNKTYIRIVFQLWETSSLHHRKTNRLSRWTVQSSCWDSDADRHVLRGRPMILRTDRHQALHSSYLEFHFQHAPGMMTPPQYLEESKCDSTPERHHTSFGKG